MDLKQKCTFNLTFYQVSSFFGDNFLALRSLFKNLINLENVAINEAQIRW